MIKNGRLQVVISFLREFQTSKTKVEELKNSFMMFFDSIKTVFKSKSFILLLVSYGFNTGVYYAMSTLLSQLVKPTFLMNGDSNHKMDRNIGLMGVVSRIVGILGSFFGGLILDKFKKFKVSSTFNHDLI